MFICCAVKSTRWPPWSGTYSGSLRSWNSTQQCNLPKLASDIHNSPDRWYFNGNFNVHRPSLSRRDEHWFRSWSHDNTMAFVCPRSEISIRNTRKSAYSLNSSTAAGDIIGFFLKTAAKEVQQRIDIIAWSLPLFIALPAFSVLIFSWCVKESPYWYVLKGEMRQAFESLCHFRKAKIVAARDLYHIYFFIIQSFKSPYLKGVCSETLLYLSMANHLIFLVTSRLDRPPLYQQTPNYCAYASPTTRYYV